MNREIIRIEHNYYPLRNDILLALFTIPLYAAAVFKYGYAILISLGISVAIGFAVEYLTMFLRRKKSNLFGFVLWMIFPLVFPPSFPFWMMGISIAFGIIIGVSFFGGHGREIASPIAIGWSFAVLSFATAFSFSWSYPFPGIQLGLKYFRASLPTIDNPVTLLISTKPAEFYNIITGNFPQPPGNSIPLILLICGIALLILRVIDIRSFVSFSGIYILLLIIYGIIKSNNFQTVPAILKGLLVGNFLFVSFFVYPVLQTSGRTFSGRWISGIMAGTSAFLIRSFSAYPDGLYFAVLFGNIFSPIIDEIVLKVKYSRYRIDEVTE